MRICYVGPVDRQAALQKFVSPGVTVEARLPEKGPASIESMWEEYLSVPPLMELAVELEREGFDAIVPGCFGDPGLDGVRELVNIPVVGPGASSMLVAANLGHRFAVVTVLESVVRPLENLATLTGVAPKLAAVRQIGVPVLELNRDREATFAQLVKVSRQTIEADRADVLVLGCGTLSFRAAELQEILGVPVINPLQVALRTAEMLVACNLSHSKRSYPLPPKLATTGLASAAD
ncbi:MAG: allantoin racemase [Thermomicrobiales bacterium]|nr:allantoin racemase [Thermomicrobiales bacterium]MEA2586218.1 allantoin racemase [Thermomicrobiales bacterium]MEA2595427.1 allantoin racemase [Thermomicrobiales bacterium]